MKSFLTICFFAIFAISTYAQNVKYTTVNDKSSSLDISLGYNSGYFKDLNFSPLNYRKNDAVLSFGYQRRDLEKGSIFNAFLAINAGTLSASNASVFKSVDLRGDIGVEYLRNIIANETGLNLYAGGKYHSDATFILFSGTTAFTFLFAHSLDASVYGEYIINDEHKLSSNFSLPIVTLLVRPPYSGFDKEVIENQSHPLRLITNGNITSLNQYVAFNWNVGYHYNYSDKMDFVARYNLSFQHTKQPLPNTITTLSNQFQVGINFKF